MDRLRRGETLHSSWPKNEQLGNRLCACRLVGTVVETEVIAEATCKHNRGSARVRPRGISRSTFHCRWQPEFPANRGVRCRVAEPEEQPGLVLYRMIEPHAC